jgi:hypothetical protein
MRESKYPNGYQPKIEYYQYQVNKAIGLLDIEAMEFYTRKLTYFMQRQQQMNKRLASLID